MNGNSGVFNFDIRVVTCKNCGAPLRAEISGGRYTCEYCSTINQLIGRSAAGFAPTTMPESERIAHLRLAIINSAPVPAMDFVVDGKVPRYFLRKAKEEWKSLRARLETSRAFVLKEKLFHLTSALVPSLAPEDQRAFLETAVEILDDERYRQILLCQTARMAARNGEVSAATSWLALCNPRSCDLDSDTAYRYTEATIAAVNGDANRIHEQLGFEEGEIPFAKKYEAAVRILRIHAKELEGDIQGAGGELYQRIDRVGIAQVKAEIERHLPLIVCASSMKWVKDLLQMAEEEKAALEKAEAKKTRELEMELLRKELSALPLVSSGRIVGTAVLAMGIAFIVSWISVVIAMMTETDPVFGIAGQIACARACEGCAPPLRTVSFLAPDEAVVTLILCDDPRHTVSSMGKGVLFSKAQNNDPTLKPFLISDWSLHRISMTFHFPLVFAIMLTLRIRSRKQKRAAIERRIAAFGSTDRATE